MRCHMAKPTRKVVTVLGNFSGRNAGDAAILGGLLKDLTDRFPDTPLQFLVPTINPRFILKAFSRYPVKPVSLLPTNLSLKILGIPIFRAVGKADLVLVTDNILFDRKLYNPLHNYLYTLSWVLPWGARRGVPVVLYNMSLGPVPTKAGKACLTRILKASKKIILREEPSIQLVANLSPNSPDPILRADCALSADPASDSTVEASAREIGVFQSGRPTLGFNVNAYIDDYVASGSDRISKSRFQEIVAGVIDRAIRELDAEVLLVCTQPMDLAVENGVYQRVQEKERVFRIQNPVLGHQEIAGFLRRLDAFVGMRTHSLILSASVHTPLAAIISYPKTTGFLRTIGMEGISLEFDRFSAETLWDLVSEVWEKREELKARLGPAVEEERKKARAAADELSEWLGP